MAPSVNDSDRVIGNFWHGARRDKRAAQPRSSRSTFAADAS
jgi:hypothetical protein